MPGKCWIVVVLLAAVAGCDRTGAGQTRTSAGAARREVPATTLAIAGDSPGAYLDRVIAAYGGAGNIARLRIGRVEVVGRGTFEPGLRGQFTLTDTFHLPHRLRREASFSDGKVLIHTLTVIDGNRGWTKTTGSGADGIVHDLQPTSEPNDTFPHSVLGPLVEMSDPAVRLSHVVSDQPGITLIVVARGGQVIGTNAFDDRTHHIVGTLKDLPGTDDRSGSPQHLRTVYSDYRKVAGIDVPMQLNSYTAGTPLLEMEIKQLEILQTVDDRLFARPD